MHGKLLRSFGRWSNNGSALTIINTGYSAKCGCCVHDNSFRIILNCDLYFYASDDDESHTIDVNATAIVLRSGTSAGAARGLATISQLFDMIQTKICWWWMLYRYTCSTNPCTYGAAWWSTRQDTFVHGHLSLIDGMYASKLNKLHIHATDSTAWTIRQMHILNWQGWVMEPCCTFYSKSDITSIVERRERFVDVIFELDTPAHTLSIARSHPEMMANCWEWLARSGYKVDVDSDDTISLNPLNMEVENCATRDCRSFYLSICTHWRWWSQISMLERVGWDTRTCRERLREQLEHCICTTVRTRSPHF